MLKLLQSIFGGEKQGNYPESLVKLAIERAVDGTDPWLRAVSGYKKKLRPAVLRAMDHVVGLVDRLPPPMPICLDCYADDPRLKRFFISETDMHKIFAKDRILAEFIQGGTGDSSRMITLMAMEKQERKVFGAALSGDVVIHDVPMVTVCFDGHQFYDASVDEEQARRHLKIRAFDYLLSQALRRLTNVKSERKELERWRTLLQAKLSLLERGGWGFNAPGAVDRLDAAAVEEQLGTIEAQLQEIGGDDGMLETYLDIVADVLGNPEEYLMPQRTTIYVDRMSIKRAEASSDAPELTFYELRTAEGNTLALQLISIQTGKRQNL